MTLRTTLGAGAAAAAALVLGLAAPAQAATTVVVYETTAEAQGWTKFVRDSGTLEWTTQGLVLSTPLSNDKVQLGQAYSGTLASITELAYETTMRNPGSIPEQRAALNLVVDVNGAAAGGFTTLVYEPVYNGGSLDAVRDGAAIWWSTRAIPGVPTSTTSYVSLADISAANPDATVSAVIINQGGGNPGLVSLVPSLTLNGTTYSFVAGAPPVILNGADECKSGGWATSTQPIFRNQGDCVSFFTR